METARDNVKSKLDCYQCGRICLAVLRNGGVARISEIAERTGYSTKLVAIHVNHLLDSGQLQAAGKGSWKLEDNVCSEKLAQ